MTVSQPNPEKVQGITSFPTLKNVRDIKSFQELVGYYRRLKKNFSQIAKPLTCPLKKDQTCLWTEKEQKAFD